jgi:superfamily II DNA or RNA helicase
MDFDIDNIIDLFSTQRDFDINFVCLQELTNYTKDKLLKYQYEHTLNIVNLIFKNGIALDGSDAGTGKSYVAIAACKELKLNPLIICPKSVIYVWKNVCEYFDITPYDIVNYETIKLAKTYDEKNHRKKNSYIEFNENEDTFKWSLPHNVIIIFDEVHRCKNKNTLNNKLLLSFRNIYCRKNPLLMLSATLIERPKELGTFLYMLKILNTSRGVKNWIKYNLNTTEQDAMPLIHKKLYPKYGSRMRISELGDNFPINQISCDNYHIDNYQEVESLYAEIKDAIKKVKIYGEISKIHKNVCIMFENVKYLIKRIHNCTILYGNKRNKKSYRYIKICIADNIKFINDNYLLNKSTSISESIGSDNSDDSDNKENKQNKKPIIPEQLIEIIKILKDCMEYIIASGNRIISEHDDNIYVKWNKSDWKKILNFASIIDEKLPSCENSLILDENKHILSKIIKCRQQIELYKIPTMIEVAQDFIDDGYSIVFFVNFTESMKLLIEKMNIKCVIYGGQPESERIRNIELFQSNQEKKIISQAKAGSEGISLHDINGGHPRVSIISPPDSGTCLKQILGRICRAGSKSRALQRIIFIGKTIEERICYNLKKKLINIDTINDGALNNDLQCLNDIEKCELYLNI